MRTGKEFPISCSYQISGTRSRRRDRNQIAKMATIRLIRIGDGEELDRTTSERARRHLIKFNEIARVYNKSNLIFPPEVDNKGKRGRRRRRIAAPSSEKVEIFEC